MGRCRGVLLKTIGDGGGECGGANYRLPSEAQWEYACRAGSTGRWQFGNDEVRGLESTADYGGPTATRREDSRVGQKKANAWGFTICTGTYANGVRTGIITDYY